MKKVSSNKMKLKLLGLPVIETLADFSLYTHLSPNIIWKLSKFSEKYYFVYSIPKRDHGKRIISQPSRELKAIQAWILGNILDKLEPSSSCKGFEKGLTILDNANPHVGSSFVLNIDIDNFFPSISSNKVFSIFATVGYNNLISSIITKICTYDNSLPQGSPCSPKISNLVCIRMDNRIQGYVGKRGIIYTRYADDMTFSGLTPYKVLHILPTIEKIVNSEGFTLNKQKTRVAGLARAKRVTGLVVNEKDAGIGTQKFQILRAKIHHLTHSKMKNNYELLNEVKGWLAFLNSVDRKRYEKAKMYIFDLQKRVERKNRLIHKINVE